jgi:hypothetical protein
MNSIIPTLCVHRYTQLSATNGSPLPPLEKGGKGGFFNHLLLLKPPRPPFSKGGVHRLSLCITISALCGND